MCLFKEATRCKSLYFRKIIRLSMANVTVLVVIFIFGVVQFTESYKFNKQIIPLVLDFLNVENIPTKVNLIHCWSKGLSLKNLYCSSSLIKIIPVPVVPVDALNFSKTLSKSNFQHSLSSIDDFKFSKNLCPEYQIFLIDTHCDRTEKIFQQASIFFLGQLFNSIMSYNIVLGKSRRFF